MGFACRNTDGLPGHESRGGRLGLRRAGLGFLGFEVTQEMFLHGWVRWLQWGKMPAANHGDLSSVPETHMVEGENHLLKLSPDLHEDTMTRIHPYVDTPSQTHTLNKCLVLKILILLFHVYASMYVCAPHVCCALGGQNGFFDRIPWV